MPKYLYITTLTDEESGQNIGHIEGYTRESLYEQDRKFDTMIEKYEKEKNAFPEQEDWEGMSYHEQQQWLKDHNFPTDKNIEHLGYKMKSQ